MLFLVGKTVGKFTGSDTVYSFVSGHWLQYWLKNSQMRKPFEESHILKVLKGQYIQLYCVLVAFLFPCGCWIDCVSSFSMQTGACYKLCISPYLPVTWWNNCLSMSASKELAPMRNKSGLVQSSPNSSFIRANQVRASFALRIPPAGLKPTLWPVCCKGAFQYCKMDPLSLPRVINFKFPLQPHH